MKYINNSTKSTVAAVAAVLFTCIAPAATAQTTTQTCEIVQHCVDINVFGVEASICVNIRECRTTSDTAQQTG